MGEGSIPREVRGSACRIFSRIVKGSFSFSGVGSVGERDGKKDYQPPGGKSHGLSRSQQLNQINGGLRLC